MTAMIYFVSQADGKQAPQRWAYDADDPAQAEFIAAAREKGWEEFDELPDLPVIPPSVPATVTMRQARLALHGAGHLAAVNAAVAAMPGSEGEAARIEWEYASEVRRDSALAQAMAVMLDLDAEALDALFIRASGL